MLLFGRLESRVKLWLSFAELTLSVKACRESSLGASLWLEAWLASLLAASPSSKNSTTGFHLGDGRLEKGKAICHVQLALADHHSCALVLDLLLSLLATSSLSFFSKAHVLVMTGDSALLSHCAGGVLPAFADAETSVGMRGLRMTCSLTLSSAFSLSVAGQSIAMVRSRLPPRPFNRCERRRCRRGRLLAGILDILSAITDQLFLTFGLLSDRWMVDSCIRSAQC